MASQSLFKTVDKKARIHRITQPAVQYFAAAPIDYRDQVDKALFQADIRDISTPHLIRTCNGATLHNRQGKSCTPDEANGYENLASSRLGSISRRPVYG